MAKKAKFLSDEEYSKLIAEARRSKTDAEKRFIKLGWQILEAKYRYYVLDQPTLSDYGYDLLEREYDALAKDLGLAPSASDMVGFRNERASCTLAADKVDGRAPPKEPV